MATRYFPWSVLDIDRTDDVLAVKQAYAARLRVTRPDDDAEAYQQLRGAYEAALLEARNSLDGSREAAEALPATIVPAATAGPQRNDDRPESAESTVPAEEILEPGILAPDPRELAAELLGCWRQGGENALMESWPQFQARLGDIPLSLRDSTSQLFAQLVIDFPDLPAGMLLRLDEHFQWRSDFRAQRILGARRIAALQARLSALAIQRRGRAKVDADAREFVEMQMLAGLLGRPQGVLTWLRQVFFAMLASERLPRILQSTDDWTMQWLGIPAAVARRMRGIAKLGSLLRMLLLPISVLLALMLYMGIGRLDAWIRAVFALVFLVIGGYLNAAAVDQAGLMISRIFAAMRIRTDPRRITELPLFHLAIIGIFFLMYGLASGLRWRFGPSWPESSLAGMLTCVALFGAGALLLQQGAALPARLVLPLLLYFFLDLFSLSTSNPDPFIAAALSGLAIASLRARLCCEGKSLDDGTWYLVFRGCIIASLVLVLVYFSDRFLDMPGTIMFLFLAAHLVQKFSLREARLVPDLMLWIPAAMLLFQAPRPGLTVSLCLAVLAGVAAIAGRNRLFAGNFFRGKHAH